MDMSITDSNVDIYGHEKTYIYGQYSKNITELIG